MSQIKIVIIEDEFFAANHLKDLIIDLGYSVVGIFHSGEDFLKETDWEFDIAIVDIRLSEKMLGLDVAAHLQKKQRPFIFLTANRDVETLTQAARLKPQAYISKPFNPNDIAVTLEIFALKQVKNLEIRGANGIEEINPNDILFIKSEGAYIEIQTINKRILQRKLLKEIEDELPENFVRTHRSFIVNRHYIDQRSAIELKVQEHTIPVSRSYKNF
ncbi:MAG: response regulator transcription factor [Crocinitomicaceae bacterium]|nr:response regulator transcription factor [Flavobacteriales bacterium]NQZ35446.1 response regulator transcription factor [Crocinitomicaceae bacterium]